MANIGQALANKSPQSFSTDIFTGITVFPDAQGQIAQQSTHITPKPSFIHPQNNTRPCASYYSPSYSFSPKPTTPKPATTWPTMAFPTHPTRPWKAYKAEPAGNPPGMYKARIPTCPDLASKPRVRCNGWTCKRPEIIPRAAWPT